MRKEKSCGFIYYCVDDEYVHGAVRSVTSLKHFMPDAQITVFTHQTKLFTNLGVEVRAVSNVFDKSLHAGVLLKSPYQHTFYIDSDTLFVGPYDDALELLDDTDLLLSLTVIKLPDDPTLPAEFPSYNGGVIGYNLTDETKKLFTTWEEQIKTDIKADPTAKDEPSLRRLIYQQGTKVQVLPNKYNFRTDSPSLQKYPFDTKLLHGHSDLASLTRSA